MKHKLLITAASLMFAISASAQWTQPAPASFEEMAEDGETTQYLYNVGVKKFFVGHNEWNTRASVDDYADPVRIIKMEGEEGYYDIAVYPSKYRTDINAWKSLSGNSWDSMWCDGDPANTGTYQGCQMWLITKIGDIYKFSNDNFNLANEFGPTEATLGVADYAVGEQGNTRCYLYYNTTVTVTKHHEDGDEDVEEEALQGNFYDEWKFVSEDVYNAYAESIEAYNAAMSLKAALDKAKSDYPGIDVSSPETVYNNTSSTPDELKAAEAEVASIIIEFLQGNASANNPQDFTAKIVNPTFDTIGDFTGWSAGFGAGGTTSTNAEVYRAVFNVYQDLSGLPAGVYMVACNGYSRYKDSVTEDYKAYKAGYTTQTKIYLESETNGTFSTPVNFISTGGSLDAQIGTGGQNSVTTEEGQLLYTPNTMAAANDYFHDGTDRYHNEAWGALAGGDVLRIGVRNDTNTDWSIFDDFQLFYYGDGEDAYQLWGSKVAENNEIEFNAPYGGPDKAKYDAAINTLKTATNKDAIMQAISDFEEIPDMIAASMAAYDEYIKAYDSALESLTQMEENNIGGPAVDKLADYLQASASDNDDLADYEFPNGCANYIIDLENGSIEGRLSTEDIKAETEYLNGLVSKAIEEGMQEGSDVTNLLTNPSFKEGFTGWKNANGGAADGKVGGLSSFPVVENFQTPVDCRQTVNAQPGVYAISVHVFERPAGNGGYDGTETTKTRLFMNQFSTPVQHIVTDAVTDEEAIDQENCYLGDQSGAWPYDYNVDGYGWVPNSVDGASYAFGAGRYLQTCYGLVGEDGVMTIGLTSDGQSLEWCLWADFKLTYMAKNEDALSEIIDHYADLAAEVTDAGKPDIEALNNAVTNAKAASGGDAMYDALFELIDAYNAAIDSQKKYEEALAVLDNLSIAITDYSGIATDEALANAETVYGNNVDLEDYAFAGSELDQKISEMNAAIAKLKLPDMSGASASNPLDITSVIVNPTYENANSDGWSGSVPNHGGYNRTDMVEYWHSTCNQYQTIYSLPAGTYELSVNAYNRYADNATTDYNAFKNGQKDEVQTASVYVTINGEQTAIPVRMIGEGARTSWDGLNGTYSTITVTNEDGSTTSYFTPNNMQGAGACFEDGTPVLDEYGEPVYDDFGNEVKTPLSDELNYINRIQFTLTEDTDVTIGIQNTDGGSWLIWDNWKLTYFGTDSHKAGDVNEDGDVDISDIVAIVNQIAGKQTYTFADVNGDNQVDISDIVAVINIIAGR